MKDKKPSKVRKFSKAEWWYIASGLATILDQTWTWLAISNNGGLKEAIKTYQHEIYETLITACTMYGEVEKLTGETDLIPMALQEPIKSACKKYDDEYIWK